MAGDESNPLCPPAARTTAPSEAQPLTEAVRDLVHRADPRRAVPQDGFVAPWSAEARAGREARKAALDAQVQVFRDELEAIRSAHEVLSRSVTLRAIEAAEISVFEMRVRGEAFRLSVLNRAHLEMVREFSRQLERIAEAATNLPAEIAEALRERALAEFTARMNAASNSGVRFDRSHLLEPEKRPRQTGGTEDKSR